MDFAELTINSKRIFSLISLYYLLKNAMLCRDFRDVLSGENDFSAGDIPGDGAGSYAR